jgi:alkanesulfonate monooxygenase SsuD/methylene tetrahydromethanopterin reductase-like flavin-dependent oxidoreductase (luciferase family)
VRIGFALPQSDHSIAGVSPITYDDLVGSARHAAGLGVDSLWLADHLVWDIAKYGGPTDVGGMFEPIVTLGALARDVPEVRLGTLVLLEALRPATLLAKSIATLDRISGGRIDIGMGAGWYEPDYTGIGMEMPRPGERLARLAECVQILRGLLGPDGGPVTFDGRFHRAAGAQVLPAAVQRPNPPVFVGGKGDRLLALVAAHADGWNTCWQWTPDAYRERLTVLERACADADRDPATVWRSLGLYALVGEDEADLARRFERLRTLTPAGVLDGVTLEQWRAGRLVGTVAEVRDQVGAWRDLGIETLILNTGATPFAVSADDDLELAVRAVRGA